MRAITRYAPRLAVLALALALLPVGLQAQSVRGSATFETRLFPNGPFPDQRRATLSPSLALEPA